MESSDSLGRLDIPYNCKLESSMYCLIQDVASKWGISFDSAVQGILHLGARIYEGAAPGQSVFVANSDGSGPLLEAGNFPATKGRATVYRVDTEWKKRRRIQKGGLNGGTSIGESQGVAE